MKRALVLALLLLLALPLGCRPKYQFKGEQGMIKADKLEAQLIWLKNKGETIDIMLLLENNYDGSLHFDHNAVRMTFNGQRSSMRKATLSGNMASRTIEKKLIFFDFHPAIDKKGVAVLTIDPIHVKTKDGKKERVPALKMELQIPPK